jgi:hypothetical protein
MMVNVTGTDTIVGCYAVYLCKYFPRVRRHSWLRHCATSRKVAGSIPYGVIGIFH